MKFCPECGAKLITQKFCQECGANISKYLGNKGGSESSDSLAGFDFSALENEASKQLREQELLADFEVVDGVLIKYKGKGGKVTIPACINSIGKEAFKDNDNITEVVIEDGVETIEGHAFFCATALRKVTIPNSVTRIAQYAFASCKALETVNIPNQLKTFSGLVFSGCTSLTDITFNPGNTYNIIDGNLYTKDCTCLILYANRRYRAHFNIPRSVTLISGGAFSGCRTLIGVTIPDGVTSIETSAFSRCENLTEVTIPGSVRTVGGGAFENCLSLSRVEICNGVEQFGWFAFAGCTSLKKIFFPKSVYEIGIGAIDDSTEANVRGFL
ncbi:MAG: leucine-rich repeat protein [Clostridia bacterium]|nr:leucine-rich repeat protein [Clostridia bacterium]